MRGTPRLQDGGVAAMYVWRLYDRNLWGVENFHESRSATLSLPDRFAIEARPTAVVCYWRDGYICGRRRS